MESRNTEWRVENYGAELRPSSYEGLIQRFFQSFNPFTGASLIVEKNAPARCQHSCVVIMWLLILELPLKLP